MLSSLYEPLFGQSNPRANRPDLNMNKPKQNRDFYITYTWTRDGQSKTKEYHIFTSTPVMALNGFHREMQRKQERSVADRKIVVRPKLKTGEYVIHRLFNRYNDINGDLIESTFDLPATQNPDVTKKKPKKAVTPEFCFE